MSQRQEVKKKPLVDFRLLLVERLLYICHVYIHVF
jgi:hypothetical protein